MSSDLETKIATLKSELKAINSEYAKIKEIPAEKRAEFGKQINEKKQAILAQIAEAEAAALETEVESLDIRLLVVLMATCQSFCMPLMVASIHS